MYFGSLTFKQKWKDLRASPRSSQYHVMVNNIENSVSGGQKNYLFYLKPLKKFNLATLK